jgi:molybdopterin-biosynthesis enzyme MoeA-like protein
LSGRTKGRNIGYIAEYLTAIGIDLKEVRVVGDEERHRRLGEMLARSLRVSEPQATGGMRVGAEISKHARRLAGRCSCDPAP